ncbi:MAG TPA: GNAT family protein [Solirubrobacteraceae bacterium]
MCAPLLTGELCTLRPLASDDVERLVEIQSEPSVARWWNLPDAQELRQKIEGRTEPLEVLLGIERDGHLIGMIQYFEEGGPDFRHAGIDLFIATEYQRHGIGTDAVRTLARHLIDERGHHRLTIDPTVDNTAAIRTYGKVGFRPVGVMREYWRSPEGVWRDGLLMDLLAREFAP